MTLLRQAKLVSVRVPKTDRLQQVAKWQLTRTPKEAGIHGTSGSMQQHIFSKFFIEEYEYRYTLGRSGMAQRAKSYTRLLGRMANIIWQFSMAHKRSAPNVAFTFLNRYYPLFVGRGVSTLQMNYYWGMFELEMPKDHQLLGMLNYDFNAVREVNGVIQEMREARKTPGFKEFLKVHVNGYKAVFPQHFTERSKLFEHVLIMLHQMRAQGQTYFVESHAIEILKAHFWFLKKFGDPVRLNLGNLVGELASTRLSNYYSWITGKQVHQPRKDPGIKVLEF